MRALYALGSVITFVVILIISFGNIQSQCTYITFFFWELSSSLAPTFIIFGTSFIGMISGMFITLFISSIMNKEDADEDDPDFEA